MALRTTGDTNGWTITTTLPTASSWTMMAYVYLVSLAVDCVVLKYGQSGNPNKVLYVQTTGVLHLAHGGADVTGSTLSLGTWYHLAMTYQTGTFLAYLNGVQDISNPHSTDPTLQLYVARNLAGVAIDGRTAACKIWHAVLSPAEIQQERRQYVPVRTANLHTFSPFRQPYEALANYGGAGQPWSLGGPVTEEAGPPIPWVLPACPGDEGYVTYQRVG